MTISIVDSKNLRRGLIAAGLAGALAVAGCANSGPNERGGTVLGAGGGAIVGGLLGGWQGAVIGGLAGGIVGNVIGRDMDSRERQYAEDSTYRAAREQRRAEWGDRGGVHGYSEPIGDYYARNGQTCHDYIQYMYKNGRDYQDRVTICRSREGSFARG